jgi:hypothetical protein
MSTTYYVPIVSNPSFLARHALTVLVTMQSCTLLAVNVLASFLVTVPMQSKLHTPTVYAISRTFYIHSVYKQEAYILYVNEMASENILEVGFFLVLFMQMHLTSGPSI